ncbi:M1 family metallopeptidase [Cognatiluteimonas weifangensis]|uniref:Aminopeptidase n=1 Tax=Cognatiluteimonas weifangensis TaxID=2303539 RepID=A0A372DJR6_9GAMM|nr:M1 family metallopeptidase [Luteimonas weifangensis]RFP59825.1 M1 family peptidase [Luteimonas weifangensis]
MILPRRCLLTTALLAATGLATAAEATVPTGPLPRTVVPSEVALQLTIDPAQPRFSGHVELSVDVASATDTIWMHGKGLNITRAVYMPRNGRNQVLTAQEVDVSGVLKLTAPLAIAPGQGVIAIDYDAPFGELQGAYRVKPDGRDYVVTQMEPLGARTAFPGFDEPSFKQPWRMTLIVPDAAVAVANAPEVASTDLDGPMKRVEFARTQALPSYLIAFAVGPWDVAAGPDIAANGERSTPIKLRGIAASGQGERMRYSLANTPAIVTALEDYFGIPYPFAKLDNLAAPDFWAGAMENAGLIVYRDSLMFPDETSAVGRRQAFWGVSAHELAHQWFGDLVTMKWWDDLWLNEGFATWMGNKIHGQLQPDAHTDRGLLEGALGAMGADSLASTRRIHEPIKDFTDIQSAFDGITYQKGGATLNMFEQYIGAEPFRTGIRNYLQAHARGNATSADLIEAVAAQSDAPEAVAKAFFSFIDQPGVPFVRVDLDCSGATPALLLEQQRYLPLGSTASGAGLWGIPLTVRYADGATVRTQKLLFDGKQGRMELSAATSCPSWVMPNAHGTGYYRFALAPQLQSALSDAFAQLDEREQRVYADSVTAAYGAGRLTPSQLLAALPQFASASVRQTVTAGMYGTEWMAEYLLADDAARDAFHAQVADIYRARLQQLGMTPKAGEPDDDALLRSSLVGFFAETLKDQAVRAQMDRAGRAVLGLGGDGALHADAVAQDLRGTALAVAVQSGGKAAFDAAEKHFRASQDAVLRSQLLGAMGSTRDAALNERVRALVFEPGLLRRNEIFPAVGGQTGDRATRPALRAWTDTHFKEIEAKLAPAGAAVVQLYAAGMCSEAEASTLQDKFAARMQDVEGGPRQLRQTVEAIRMCAAQVQARKGQPLKFPMH